jgi:hypothetical protein
MVVAAQFRVNVYLLSYITHRFNLDWVREICSNETYASLRRLVIADF